jgi:hypothetical protein
MSQTIFELLSSLRYFESFCRISDKYRKSISGTYMGRHATGRQFDARAEVRTVVCTPVREAGVLHDLTQSVAWSRGIGDRRFVPGAGARDRDGRLCGRGGTTAQDPTERAAGENERAGHLHPRGLAPR